MRRSYSEEGGRDGRREGGKEGRGEEEREGERKGGRGIGDRKSVLMPDSIVIGQLL